MKFILLLLMILSASLEVFSQVSFRKILGKWELYEVYNDDAEVTDQYVQYANHWVEFRSDQTFVSEGEPYGRREGKFMLDESTGLLSFDMDLGFTRKSYLQVEFDGQKMIWTGKGNPGTDNIKIILIPAL